MNALSYVPTGSKIRSAISFRDKFVMCFNLLCLFVCYPFYHLKWLRLIPIQSIMKDYRLKVQGIVFVMPGNCPPENSLMAGWYEPEVKSIISQFRKGVFVDCGAGIGLYTLMVSKNMQDDGRVLAFEPDTRMFKRLQTSVIMNHCENVTIYDAAAWWKEETLRLYSHPAMRFQSSVKDDSGPASYSGHFKDVPALTIDSLIPKGSPVLMKIDVEGAEPEAMIGATKTLLRKDVTVIFEALTEKALQRCKSVIEPLGYQISRLSERDYLATRK